MSRQKENILSAIAFCTAYIGRYPNSNPNKMMEAACKKFGISLQSKTFRDVLELRAEFEADETMHQGNVSLERRGFHADRQIVIGAFHDQSAAEDYLKALPAQYSGRCYKSENEKWTVAYHRFDVPDPTSNDKRGN